MGMNGLRLASRSCIVSFTVVCLFIVHVVLLRPRRLPALAITGSADLFRHRFVDRHQVCRIGQPAASRYAQAGLTIYVRVSIVVRVFEQHIRKLDFGTVQVLPSDDDRQLMAQNPFVMSKQVAQLGRQVAWQFRQLGLQGVSNGEIEVYLDSLRF